MHPLLSKDNRGFTLTEIMIALAIFTIGILAVNAMQIASIKGNSKARQITEAGNLACDRIERIIALDYDDSALADDDGDGTDQDADLDGVDDDGGNFGLDHETAATADHSTISVDGNYKIFWNIAVDQPVYNNKTIRFIAVYDDDPADGGKGKTVFDYIKKK
ncbi:MAG: type IV pilus modification PilV family protein [Thermodesulfobacteriota bacterium]